MKLVKEGKPYVMFGDGRLAACKPISEADLGAFMADCVKDQSKANQVLPIGGALIQASMHKTLIETWKVARKCSLNKNPKWDMEPMLAFLLVCALQFRSDFCMCAGPGKAWTALEQGEYLFELAERKPNFIKVPVALMDGIIGFLDLLAKVFPGLEVPHAISTWIAQCCPMLHVNMSSTGS